LGYRGADQLIGSALVASAAEDPATRLGRPTLGPLVPAGADRLVGLELDQLLEDQGHCVAHDAGAAAGAVASSNSDRADCDRAIGVSYVNPARNTLRITPVAPAPIGQAASGAALNSHHSGGHSCSIAPKRLVPRFSGKAFSSHPAAAWHA
jgi:hypothetical protein